MLVEDVKDALGLEATAPKGSALPSMSSSPFLHHGGIYDPRPQATMVER